MITNNYSTVNSRQNFSGIKYGKSLKNAPEKFLTDIITNKNTLEKTAENYNVKISYDSFLFGELKATVAEKPKTFMQKISSFFAPKGEATIPNMSAYGEHNMSIAQALDKAITNLNDIKAQKQVSKEVLK